MSAQAVQFNHLFMTKPLVSLVGYGSFKADRVSMQNEYSCTCTCCVHSILILQFSFIQRLILTDSSLSVIWWQALLCLTSCCVALLCTKTVKIILWALYLQPTLKSYSQSILSFVRSARVGKGPELNTLKYWAACFFYTENNSNSLDLLWTSECELSGDMTGARFEKFFSWFGLRLVSKSFNDLTTT